MTRRSRIFAEIYEGIASGFPIILGYFPVAMAFGLLSRNINIPFRDSCLFSIMVFAGASQFMALDLIKGGVAAGNIILATFLLNLRHLMMSASLSVKLKEIKRSWLVFVAFGVTDETFSISSLSGKKLSIPFLLALNGGSYLSWVLGTFAGYLAGQLLPVSVQNSLAIGLYAMFMALLVPEVKKSLPVLLIAIISAILYSVISCLKLLPASWSLIASIVISSGVGAVFVKDDGKEQAEEKSISGYDTEEAAG